MLCAWWFRICTSAVGPSRKGFNSVLGMKAGRLPMNMQVEGIRRPALPETSI